MNDFKHLEHLINRLTLKVNDKIILTEVRDGDCYDLVKQFNDPKIYKNTLNIPYPYALKTRKNLLILQQEV